jgi:hypothetical protein
MTRLSGRCPRLRPLAAAAAAGAGAAVPGDSDIMTRANIIAGEGNDMERAGEDMNVRTDPLAHRYELVVPTSSDVRSMSGAWELVIAIVPRGAHPFPNLIKGRAIAGTTRYTADAATQRRLIKTRRLRRCSHAIRQSAAHVPVYFKLSRLALLLDHLTPTCHSLKIN